jgi:ABC-2 type transport system permease protein
MKIMRETWFIYRRNVQVWLAQPAMVAASVFTAAFMFLLFGAPLSGIANIPGFPSDDYQAFLTGMVIVMVVVFNGADVAMALLTDMLSGYFDKLLLAPINRFSILMGALLVAGTRSLAQVVAVIGIALALGVRFETGILGIATVVIAASIFGIAFGCIGIMMALKTKSVQLTQTSWIMFMPVTFLTSAFMPRELLTGWFKVAVSFNPVEYVLVGIRAIIIEGWVWDSIAPGLYVLVGMTVGLISAATWMYRRATV